MGRSKKFKFRPRRRKPNTSEETVASSSEPPPPPPPPPPPWIDLPADVTANILKRLDVEEILDCAQKVCSTWRRVCHDPSMWRVLKMSDAADEVGSNMCRYAVDLSQGQLLDISFSYFPDDRLMLYIAHRSINLKCVSLHHCHDITGEGLVEAVKMLSHLEELHLTHMSSIHAEYVESIGISCPTLKSFSFDGSNYYRMNPIFYDEDDEADVTFSNRYALAIAKSMPNICHLRLIEHWMNNDGLEAILDGCPHLESLDLRKCSRLDLQQGALGRRCSEQIKHVKFPTDSTRDIEWLVDHDGWDEYFGYSDYSYDSIGAYEDYDDYTNPFDYEYFGDEWPWIL